MRLGVCVPFINVEAGSEEGERKKDRKKERDRALLGYLCIKCTIH